jgi:2-methylisocitrate lyase-like PEP mutase family enzyme
MGVWLHPENAAFAAFTALSRSFAVDMGTVDSKVPSMGEITSNFRSVVGATNCPLM